MSWPENQAIFVGAARRWLSVGGVSCSFPTDSKLQGCASGASHQISSQAIFGTRERAQGTNALVLRTSLTLLRLPRLEKIVQLVILYIYFVYVQDGRKCYTNTRVWIRKWLRLQYDSMLRKTKIELLIYWLVCANPIQKRFLSLFQPPIIVFPDEYGWEFTC